MANNFTTGYNTVTGGVMMKNVCSRAFHITIILMGILLVMNILFPTFQHGVYCCMLVLFIIGTLLLKLSSISEKMKERVRGGM